MLKRFFAVAAAVIVCLSLSVGSFAADNKNDDRTFLADDCYVVDKILASPIKTIEANILFPADISPYQKGGIILGNYGGSGGVFNVSVESGGNPRIMLSDNNGINIAKTFTDVSVYTGDWVNLAFVIDGEAGEIRCFVNGELKSTLAKTIPELKFFSELYLGNDGRKKASDNFTGKIKSIALYSDIRDAEKIKGDMQSLSKDNLVASWEFGNGKKDTYIDVSGNGYDARTSGRWFYEKKPITDYDYSVVFVGDTQYVTKRFPDKLHYIYDWIIDNKDSKKIKCVMGLGDITDGNSDAEWKLGFEQITRLDGVVPYSVVRGNHDKPQEFLKYFSQEPYASSYSGAYLDQEYNTWREFSAGDRRYLVFALDINMNSEVFQWASNVIRQHPNHNVIITTHVYLHSNGQLLGNGSITECGGSITPQVVWDEFVSQHKNISLMVSGHVHSDKIVVNQRAGKNGNIVTEMLIDQQTLDTNLGGVGTIAVMYFKNGSDKVQVETYSTIREQYLLHSNQFEMTIHTVEGGDDALVETSSRPAPSRVVGATSKNNSSKETSSQTSSKVSVSSNEETSSAEASSLVSSQKEETESAAVSSEVESGEGSPLVWIITIGVVLCLFALSWGAFIVYNKMQKKKEE